MTKASENVFPKIQFSEETAPATPSTGEAVVYVKSDGKLYLKDDAGTETDLTASGGGSPTFSGFRLTDGSDQSIASGVWVSINLDTEDLDTDAFHDTVTNNTRATVPVGKAGVYALTGTVRFDGNGTGRRGVRLYFNGTTEIATNLQDDVGTNAISLQCHTIYDLAEGDYVEVQAFQSSGASLNAPLIAKAGPVLAGHLLG